MRYVPCNTIEKKRLFPATRLTARWGPEAHGAVRVHAERGGQLRPQSVHALRGDCIQGHSTPHTPKLPSPVPFVARRARPARLRAAAMRACVPVSFVLSTTQAIPPRLYHACYSRVAGRADLPAARAMPDQVQGASACHQVHGHQAHPRGLHGRGPHADEKRAHVLDGQPPRGGTRAAWTLPSPSP